MPSQSLANHRSESSGKDSTVTQSPGWNPPSPPPQPTSGRSHNLRAAPLPFSPSSQENSRGPFGQQRSLWSAGRQEGQSQHLQMAGVTLDHFIPYPAHLLHEKLQGLTPAQCDPQSSPKSAPKPFGGLENPAQLPSSSHNLLPSCQLSSGWEVWECPLGGLEKGQHPWNGVEQQWDCPTALPKLPGAGKGSMS